MRIAIKRDATIVDEDGHVTGHDAGATLVRRLLRLFPNSMLVGPGARHCEGFDLVPLEFIDPEETVVINMDVVDSLGVWNTLFHTSGGAHPRIMNFVWWPTSSLVEEVQLASFALSCALFPTFANSERTATEVREEVAKWTVGRLSEKAKLAWVNLGFRLEHVQPREEPEVPVVLYPAIYLSERKGPQEFMAIVDEVHRRTPIEVEMRLHESHLVSEPAMEISRRNWVWVGPLTASRTSYWHALAHTTAFVATATDESYGLSYVEAMGAGAIGILPDRMWARALVPTHYPFLYRTREEAEDLLERAVTDTAACRAELDALVGGSFVEWIQHRHSDDAFDREIRERVHTWFGE